MGDPFPLIVGASQRFHRDGAPSWWIAENGQLSPEGHSNDQRCLGAFFRQLRAPIRSDFLSEHVGLAPLAGIRVQPDPDRPVRDREQPEPLIEAKIPA
jgi:hypothetical protein